MLLGIEQAFRRQQFKHFDAVPERPAMRSSAVTQLVFGFRQGDVKAFFAEPNALEKILERKCGFSRTRVAVNEVLDPSTPPPKAADAMGRSAQNFVLETVVSRGGEYRRAFTRGRDSYAVTAPLTGEAVERLIGGTFRSAGVKAPGEVFDAEELLRSLAPEHATFEVATR